MEDDSAAKTYLVHQNRPGVVTYDIDNSIGYPSPNRIAIVQS
jgi:hypothetical protein